MKNKFIFKKEFYDLIKDLTDKQAGEFVKGVCGYAFEGKPFITKDEYLKGLFLYGKRELDVSKQNSINGKKGADKRAEAKRCGEVIGIVLESVMVSSTAREDAAGE